jgi:general secretion pathway protein G
VQGFTLVEILIVVIILGILAAIVIPQFTNASSNARESNITTQLQSLRQQIALYQLQHNNTYPKLITTGWTVLTEYTDVNGNVSATADATHIYGPYLESIPTNPLTATATAQTVAADASGSPGWVYSESLGKICATGTVSTNYFNEATGADTSTRPW